MHVKKLMKLMKIANTVKYVKRTSVLPNKSDKFICMDKGRYIELLHTELSCFNMFKGNCSFQTGHLTKTVCTVFGLPMHDTAYHHHEIYK